MAALSPDEHQVLGAVLTAARLALVPDPRDPLTDADALRMLYALLPIIRRKLPDDMIRQDEYLSNAAILYERLKLDIVGNL